MSKAIPLSRGRSALVSDSDYDWLSQWNWMVVGDSYAGRFDRDTHKLVYMHRAIMNAEPEHDIDHINGDRLDNQRENLRVVTPTQNHQNRRKGSHNTSGFKGVSWYKRLGKWHVRISIERKRVHLGYIEDLETAALLYDAAARYFFGEYARPNHFDIPTPSEVQAMFANVLERLDRNIYVLQQLNAGKP